MEYDHLKLISDNPCLKLYIEEVNNSFAAIKKFSGFVNVDAVVTSMLVWLCCDAVGEDWQTSD